VYKSISLGVAPIQSSKEYSRRYSRPPIQLQQEREQGPRPCNRLVRQLLRLILRGRSGELLKALIELPTVAVLFLILLLLTLL
jgi:hypothetical protein